jgi:inner membrane protein
MTDPSFNSPPPSHRPLRLRGADWGGKALLVCALAVLMTIPGMFVWALIKDRSDRSEGVVAEVSHLQGGTQQVLGPLMIAPYTIPATKKDAEPVTGWYVVSPETGAAALKVKADTLRRGIFDVPVYRAVADIDAAFGPRPAAEDLPKGATVDWSKALIVVGFSDLRGAKSDVAATLTTPAGSTRLAFAPAAGVNLGNPSAEDGGEVSSRAARAGIDATGGRFGLVVAPAGALAASAQGGSLKTNLTFTGAQRLSVMPFAKSTRVTIAGDWPAPKFDGGFLPETRTLGEDGFKASWSVPFMARGLAAAGPEALSLSELGGKDLGVTFTRTNNPYQNVMRALKYAVMFVGLVFLTFFVFEALSGSRLHPAQYVLIGLAQMVFYLLLLSLSEYIGFDLGFAVAAVATVLLIGLYAGAAFKAMRYRIQALVIFTTVYGLIYLLMRLEDFALLAGSIAAFVGLTAGMWLTRNIDWYGGRAEPAPGDTQISS